MTNVTDDDIRSLLKRYRDSPGVTYECGIALGHLTKTRHGQPVTAWRIARAREYCAEVMGTEGRL